jgi:hypothetical protein
MVWPWPYAHIEDNAGTRRWLRGDLLLHRAETEIVPIPRFRMGVIGCPTAFDVFRVRLSHKVSQALADVHDVSLGAGNGIAALAAGTSEGDTR